MKTQDTRLRSVLMALPLLAGLLLLQSFLIYSLMTGSQVFANSFAIADAALRVIFFAGSGIVFGGYARRFTAKKILVLALGAGIFVLAVEWCFSEFLVDIFLLKKNHFYLAVSAQAILICVLVVANRSQSSEFKNGEPKLLADFYWLLCGTLASILTGAVLYIWHRHFNGVASRQTIQLVCSSLIFALPLALSFSSVMRACKLFAINKKLLGGGFYINLGVVILILLAITLM